MSQLTLALKNAGMSEMAVNSGREQPETHICEGDVCTMVRDCEYVTAWRAERRAAARPVPARRVGEAA